MIQLNGIIKAYSWALALNSGGAAARCCRTARAPRLSEHAGAGVLRWKYWRQARRLTDTARAPHS
eukprot:12061048-Alexandrium_andersonii.AAC.1